LTTRARALETAAEEVVVVEATQDHGQPAVPQAPPERLVRLEHHAGDLLALEVVDQRRDRRPVAKDQDEALELVRHQPRQALLEAALEVGNHEHRKQQEDEKDPEELHRDHKGDHDRMPPLVVVPIAGGGQRLGGPGQALPEAALLPLEQLHPQHVGQRNGEDSQRQDSQQTQSRFAVAAHRLGIIHFPSGERQCLGQRGDLARISHLVASGELSSRERVPVPL
jgi:hypothetical protein